jgi:pimeloyl-ACP methyl ester carboxylesterase
MATLPHERGRLEYRIYPGDPDLPDAVFLHEGLGSVAQWSRLPALFNHRTGMRTLVYSRHGYGGSEGRGPSHDRYLHSEALDILPRVLSDLGISPEPLLVGHSDGASIASIYASARDVLGVVLIAPHVVFEEFTADGIRSTRENFDASVLPSLTAFHDDPVALFTAWSGVWLSAGFRRFDLTGLLPAITAPVLVIQGCEDDYGTSRQVDLVKAHVSGPTDTVLMSGVGHHPHLESLEESSQHIYRFVHGLLGQDSHVA